MYCSTTVEDSLLSNSLSISLFVADVGTSLLVSSFTARATSVDQRSQLRAALQAP